MRLLCAVVIVGFLIGCGGGGKGGNSGGAGSSGTIPPKPKLATTVDHNGGKVTVNDPVSPIDGASIDIPAGALTQPTTITINPVQSTSPVMGALPIDFGPDGTTFAVPVTITVPYTDTLLQTYDDAPQDFLVLSRRTNGEYEIHDVTTLDQTRRLVTTTTSHFSEYEITFSRSYLLFKQPRTLFDETAAPYRVITRTTTVSAGTLTFYYPVVVYSGITTTAQLGKGSLANFWKGGRNVIILHGLLSSPATHLFSSNPVMVNKAGLLWTLRTDPAFNLYDNIILYQYPSGVSVAENAKWLADTVKKNAQAGFKTDIIAHSMGGVVARSAIEQFGLSPYIERLITLGSPHEGGQLNDYTTYISDRKIVATTVGIHFPGIADIIGSSVFLNDAQTGLNVQFAFSKIAPTEYYLIVGKKTPSSDNDGLVKETSAAPQYLVATPNHTATFTNVEHSELHTKARTNGVLMKIREWVTGQTNRSPVVDAGQDQTVTVNTQVTLTGSATDADQDTITYAWTQTGGPTTPIANATSAMASATPTQTGVYVFELTVSDTVATGTDTVMITVNPIPPVVPGQQTFAPTLDTHESTDAQYNNSNPNRAQYGVLASGNTQTGPTFWTEITFATVPTTIPQNATIVSATLALEMNPATTAPGVTYNLTNGAAVIASFATAATMSIDVTASVQSQVQNGNQCFFTIEATGFPSYAEFYSSESIKGIRMPRGNGPALTIEWQ